MAIRSQMPADFGFVAAQFGTRYSATAGSHASNYYLTAQVFVGLKARDAAVKFIRRDAEVTEEMIRDKYL